MAAPRLRVFPRSPESSYQEHQGPSVRVSLRDLLPLIALAKRQKFLWLDDFLDDEVRAGHGGLALELLEAVPDVESVVVPVGGGGLITGVATALKARNPRVRVIGVQSDGYPLWREAFASGGRASPEPRTIADGTTAPWTQAMHSELDRLVDSWITVPEPRLRAAVAELASRAKVVAEGAGALPYAALEQLGPGPVTAAVISGGNLDGALLSELLEGG